MLPCGNVKRTVCVLERLVRHEQEAGDTVGQATGRILEDL